MFKEFNSQVNHIFSNLLLVAENVNIQCKDMDMISLRFITNATFTIFMCFLDGLSLFKLFSCSLTINKTDINSLDHSTY